MKNSVSIYTLSDPRNGEVRYVGRTSQPTVRYNNHLNTDRGLNKKWIWIKSLKAENLKPVMEILEDVPEDLGLETEKFWIESFRFYGCRLMNSDIGGSGTLSIDAKRRARSSRMAGDCYKKSPESISRMLDTRRRNGSQQGEKHPHAKLSNDQIRQLRSMAGTIKNIEIARIFNISPSTVGKIISGKAWASVT